LEGGFVIPGVNVGCNPWSGLSSHKWWDSRPKQSLNEEQTP
jgi:hypothetical protein